MLQPGAEPWTAPEEGLLVYDRTTKSVTALTSSFTAEIEDFGAKLFLLYPQQKGWAVIGRIDKYLPSAAVKLKSVSEDRVVFTLRESGPLVIWSTHGTPEMLNGTFERIGENLYE